jgi:hypothetical protein
MSLSSDIVPTLCALEVAYPCFVTRLSWSPVEAHVVFTACQYPELVFGRQRF